MKHSDRVEPNVFTFAAARRVQVTIVVLSSVRRMVSEIYSPPRVTEELSKMPNMS